MIDEILKLKKEKNAVILAHNYELPEIQDIADYVGDSLGLSQAAADTEADVIVFCGVHFMAETASIISPDKTVLIPDLEAGCSLASTINAEQLREWKRENPDAVVVSYINTTAEVKAETDYCCTSGNALQVIKAISEDKDILFLPDRYLGNYVKNVTGRNIKIWDGACHVHEKINESDFKEKITQYPNAEFLIHPECGCSTACMLKSVESNHNIKIHSTEGMLNHIRESNSDKFVIATEVGILHRMKKMKPESEFLPMSDDSVCEYMKMIDLEKLLYTLKNNEYEVKVSKDIADKARVPIMRMLAIK